MVRIKPGSAICADIETLIFYHKQNVLISRIFNLILSYKAYITDFLIAYVISLILK